LIEARGDKLIGVWNKTDLAQAAAGGGATAGGAAAGEADRSGQPRGGGPGIPEGFLPLSAQTGAGFDALQDTLRQRLVPALDESGAEPVIDSARQKQLIERCIAALDEVENGLDAGMPVDAVALDLQDAVNALGEITGEVTTADILDTMFSGFCVGK
jgi:tRNA U34 5-carboxymethylaminomethyl modifying GTPase MnmE/TrmE